MYNKRVLSTAVSELGKAKAPTKKKDIPVPLEKISRPFVSSDGYKQGPPPIGQHYRIPSDTLYNPTPYKIKAVSDNKITQYLEPNDTTNKVFPGAKYVDEYPAMAMGGNRGTNRALFYEKGGPLLTKKVKCKQCGWTWDAADGGNDLTTCHKCGGQGLVQARKGGEKKYSRSLEAKNRLFVENALTKKKKSRKKKIFDPNAKYFRNGGFQDDVDYVEADLTPEEIAEYRAGGYIIDELPVAQNGVVSDSRRNYNWRNRNLQTQLSNNTGNLTLEQRAQGVTEGDVLNQNFKQNRQKKKEENVQKRKERQIKNEEKAAPVSSQTQVTNANGDVVNQFTRVPFRNFEQEVDPVTGQAKVTYPLNAPEAGFIGQEINAEGNVAKPYTLEQAEVQVSADKAKNLSIQKLSDYARAIGKTMKENNNGKAVAPTDYTEKGLKKFIGDVKDTRAQIVRDRNDLNDYKEAKAAVDNGSMSSQEFDNQFRDSNWGRFDVNWEATAEEKKQLEESWYGPTDAAGRRKWMGDPNNVKAVAAVVAQTLPVVAGSLATPVVALANDIFITGNGTKKLVDGDTSGLYDISLGLLGLKFNSLKPLDKTFDAYKGVSDATKTASKTVANYVSKTAKAAVEQVVTGITDDIGTALKEVEKVLEKTETGRKIIDNTKKVVSSTANTAVKTVEGAQAGLGLIKQKWEAPLISSLETKQQGTTWLNKQGQLVKKWEPGAVRQYKGIEKYTTPSYASRATTFAGAVGNIPTFIANSKKSLEKISEDPTAAQNYINLGWNTLRQVGDLTTFQGTLDVLNQPAKVWQYGKEAVDAGISKEGAWKGVKSLVAAASIPRIELKKEGGDTDINKHRQLLRDWTYGADIGMLQEADGGEYWEDEIDDATRAQLLAQGYQIEDLD